jgi:hypothetical protein
MNKLTLSQKFQIALCVLGILMTASAQLDVLVGPAWTKIISSFAGLAVSMLSGIGAIVTGQGQQVAAVVELAKDPTSAVQGVVTTDTDEGRALAKSIPGPIYTAGSDKATEVAKA